MAIQKLGVAISITAKSLPKLSSQVSRFTADKTPRRIPNAREKEGGAGELDGGGKAFKKHFAGRPLQKVGFSQVQPDDVRQKVPVLDVKRPVQPQPFLDHFVFYAALIRSEHVGSRVSGELDAQKYRHAEDQQSNHGLEYPGDDIPVHGAPPGRSQPSVRIRASALPPFHGKSGASTDRVS